MTAVEYAIHTSDEPVSERITKAGDLDHLRPLPRISIHAFCQTDGMAKIMEKSASDRRMSKISLRINSGGIAAAATMFTSAPTPNLIILETLTESSAILAELAQLAEVCDPSTKVVIIGRFNDINLYRDLIRHGVSEYLVAPIAMSDILNAIAAIFVDPDAEPLGRSIAFIGAKGGIGSSTIAHNCAFAISNLFATEVILADLDLAYGTANIDFDQDPTQGIAEAVYAAERLDEVFLDRLLTKCSAHLSLLAAPSLLDRAYDFDRLAFHPIIDMLQRNAPVTVLDVPHSWNDWTRSLLADLDEVIICATPDLANLRNAKNLFDALRKLRPHDRPPLLILNQVGMPKRPEIAPQDFCEPLEVEPIALIPFDAQLFGIAANSGRMISETDPKAAISAIFSEIAHVITGRTTIKKPKKTGLGRVMNLLGRK